MIVQTIEISLSKGRAPDLLAHVAETGREIEMIPNVKISADDYTAEIDTVKPDGTFTMTNCNIDENGHIIAPIAEQAVAVKGLCHYIIKIYNDDVVVYSACGSLWVDDHLITDDMIESVAEVNGYRFPQDFPTFVDLPTTADFIDDNVITDDKSWSSDKIAAELLHVYSTAEQVVGTWIDGRTLYEKTIDMGSISAHTSKLVDHNITNLDKVVSIMSTAFNTAEQKWNMIPRVDDDAAYQRGISVSATQIIIPGPSQSQALTNVFVTIRYTKTRVKGR